jgi:hypothetical protein
MAVPKPGENKYKQTAIQKKLKQLESGLVDMDAYRLRCRLESMRWRPIQKYKDVVDLLELQINKLMCVEEGKPKEAMIKEVSAMAYVSAVTLQAMKLAKAESAPQEQLSTRLQQEHLSLNMTNEEIRALSRATNINVQINVLNSVAERPDMQAIKGEVVSQDLLSPHENRAGLPPMLETTLRNAVDLARGIEHQEELLDFAPLPHKEKEDEENQD